MFARPRLGALGLRGRIVGALLVTAVATLVVAAAALLGPLETVLKSAAQSTLKTELRNDPTAPFRRLDPSIVGYTAIQWKLAPKQDQAKEHDLALEGESARDAIQLNLENLAEKVDANEINLLSASNAPRLVVIYPEHSDIATDDSYRDVAQAVRGRRPHPVYSFGTVDGTDYVQAALPFTTRAARATPNGPIVPATHWVLAIRKKIDEIPGAVNAVAKAFFVAAVVALALTLILGIPLSARIVRRLARLRQAALRLAEGGPPVEVPVDRVRDEVGDLARTFALMQGQLQRQEEVRRAFVATASHELRTPLATLDGMLELLDEDLHSPDPDLVDAQSLVERARAQSRRLGRLAADLLDLSRLDARVELRSEPVELSELSRAVLAEFELAIADRGIVTVLDDRAGSVWALGDPGSVARILRILLDNAIRLSPGGGEVTVELQDGSQASLTVSDHGPGVTSDEQELIFERFMRGRQAAGNAGFGLGLAIGRELAERMGGELVLEDRDAPGARFTLRLPVTHAPEEEPIAVA